MAQLDETYDGCPRCGSSFVMNKALKLFYSTCCGRKVCADCVEVLFLRLKKQKCPKCGETNERKSFVVENINVQRYNSEVKIRKRLSSVFNAQVEDFATLREFDDYLEMVEDVVYDMVHGSDEDRRAAEQRVDEYAAANQTKIAERAMREMNAPKPMDVDEEDDGRNEEIAQVTMTMDTVQIRVPGLLAMGEKPTNNRHMNEPAHVRHKRLIDVSKIPGGFDINDDWQRCFEESFGVLLHRSP